MLRTFELSEPPLFTHGACPDCVALVEARHVRAIDPRDRPRHAGSTDGTSTLPAVS
ncbi:MAG: hypothetical protein ACXVRS_12425 [Gaiellaceae bacterium]